MLNFSARIQLSCSCRYGPDFVCAGEFEPSFGDFKQFGLFFFFASSLLRGSQSFLSVAAILFSFADHAIAAETFRKSKFRGEGMLSLVIWKT